MNAKTCLVLAFALAGSLARPTLAQTAAVTQGGIARWSGQDAVRCGVFGRSFDAVEGTCYYPVDVRTKPGRHQVALWDKAGRRKTGSLEVAARACPRAEIELDKLEYIDVSPENSARAAKERARVDAVIGGEAKAKPRFVLPLAPPAAGVAARTPNDFCENRLYNGKVESFHSGLDFPIGKGTPITALADGKVVLAEDQFFSGKAVYVDHGGGLVTMLFHLDAMATSTGADVARGDRLGTVGEGGRTTGPHLHLGARWQNQIIDAGLLLGDPGELPDLAAAKPSK